MILLQQKNNQYDENENCKIKQIAFLCLCMFNIVAFLMTLQNIGSPNYAVMQIESKLHV